MEINTTLLREKFVIRDLDRPGDAPIVAVSNRFVLPLMTAQGKVAETFVIRAQNMHICIRMAALILNSFQRVGPLMARAEAFDFEAAWGRCCSDFEVACNLSRWICIYHKGKEVFAGGSHHLFLDVIEKCDAKNPGNYDRAVGIAEETFLGMGRKVSISYEANIGMVMHVKPDIGRCGLIHRGAEKSSTFNFVVEPKGDKGDMDVSPVMCLNVCAAFLEGIQLAFKVGMAKDKLSLDLIDGASSEAKQMRMAKLRLEEVNAEIGVFIEKMHVRFRPEKPEFFTMISDAERYHRKIHEASLRY